jgi:cell division transport system ATP-binding protein
MLFKRFNEVGVTVVIATHDVHLIEHFGARRIVLGDGRLADAGTHGASDSASRGAVHVKAGPP